MATIMTKRGQQDNVVTYEHICDTTADMVDIDPQYITLGSICTVLKGESGGLELYIANSNKEWTPLSTGVIEGSSSSAAAKRVAALDGTTLAGDTVINVVGIPTYLTDFTDYAAYNLTESGWYVFTRVVARIGDKVGTSTTVTGAAGYIATPDAKYIDIAVRFDELATPQTVTIKWNASTDTYVFMAHDLAIQNLDYRVTFYIYDIDKYTTWSYALTADTTFDAKKAYYTEANGEYTLASVTAGDPVPENTYYNHSKVRFEGMTPNITYKCSTIIDCPMEFVLPVVEDDVHGCWFEIRCRHAGEYSMTLLPQDPEAKVATEHTQKETAGINMINLHYTSIDGIKLWRFLNTHSTIPE